MAPTAVHVVWLRRDLRLHDHEPFTVACAAARVATAGSLVVPVYVIDEAETRRQARRAGGGNGHGQLAAAAQVAELPRIGPHRARFLIECLAVLRAQLEVAGSRLLVRRGAAAEELMQVCSLRHRHIFSQ
jgi:deoxyribodipyrimidine photo-lyase